MLVRGLGNPPLGTNINPGKFPHRHQPRLAWTIGAGACEEFCLTRGWHIVAGTFGAGGKNAERFFLQGKLVVRVAAGKCRRVAQALLAIWGLVKHVWTAAQNDIGPRPPNKSLRRGLPFGGR